MPEMKNVILKAGKEKALKNHHHWIFSGAIDKWPAHENGDVLNVLSSKNEFLGSGYFNRKASIAGRMLAFDDRAPNVAIKEHLHQAWLLRNQFFQANTNAYRLVNGEGDFLPGLVIDRYDDVFVIQITTLGMHRFLPLIQEFLVKTFQPRTIIEKSTGPARKEEGLLPSQGFLYGEEISEVVVKENDLKLIVNPMEGQKTGFFLDHREMRYWVRELAKDKSVLNCFSYSGGFSLNALSGGAKKVTSVDISESAIALARRNVTLNGFKEELSHAQVGDVFQFLREDALNYDIIILDPPAFAKKAKDVIQACRGYKDINRLAMQKMPAGSLLLTCSCSYYVDEELFQKVLFQAAVEAKRNVRIVGSHRQAFDHPINICHKESDYLKSFLLHIS